MTDKNMDSSVFDGGVQDTGQPSVAIVLPPRKMDSLANGLIDLTEAIAERDADAIARGLLGGPFGYGGYWDDDLFMMHPYCWCEREDCPWCAGCDCPMSAFHYFVDGNEVDYAEWTAFFDRETGGLKFSQSEREHKSWTKKADAANRRRTEHHDPVCDYCLGRGIFAGYPPGHSAPNFWHKPTGLMVWWYKYIGRSMEALGGGAKLNMREVINECIEHVKTVPQTVVR